MGRGSPNFPSRHRQGLTRTPFTGRQILFFTIIHGSLTYLSQLCTFSIYQTHKTKKFPVLHSHGLESSNLLKAAVRQDRDELTVGRLIPVGLFDGLLADVCPKYQVLVEQEVHCSSIFQITNNNGRFPPHTVRIN